MNITISEKDICKTESFLSTDIATISLFCSIRENGRIDIDTGSDGNFKTIVYFMQELSPEEQALVYKKEETLILDVDNRLYAGSAEWMDENPGEALSKNYLDSYDLPNARYLVDAYSLLIKVTEDKPRFIQFAFCLYPENKYPNSKATPQSANNPVSLKYTN